MQNLSLEKPLTSGLVDLSSTKPLTVQEFFEMLSAFEYFELKRNRNFSSNLPLKKLVNRFMSADYAN